MDVKHAIVSDLKAVVAQLGRVPTREEYRKHGKFSRDIYSKHFGNWTILLQACGLEKPKKNIFHADLKEQLKEHETILNAPKLSHSGNYGTIVIVGDTHFPFVDKAVMSAVYLQISILKPDIVVQIGDLYDMFSHGRFPRTHNVYTPAQEMEISNEMAKDFWKTVRSNSPGVKCFQILGNHDVRPMKQLLSKYPEGEVFFSFKQYFDFEGVETIIDPRQELFIGDICFMHGYRSKLGEHRDHNFMNTVTGHSHVGGVVFRQHNGRALWELNAGYVGDPKSKGLSYTPQRITKWVHGIGVIDQFGPRFIPL